MNASARTMQRRQGSPRAMGLQLACLGLAVALLLPMAAEAKRLGGGKTIGRPAPTQRDAAPPQAPTTPAGSNKATQGTAQNAATPAAGATAPAAVQGAAAQAARKPWGGLLGGLAAGLGLAALLSWMGLGAQFAEMMATLLMVGLLLLAGLFVWRMLRRPAASAQPAWAGSAPQRSSPTEAMHRVAPPSATHKRFDPDNTYTGGIGGEAMTASRPDAGALGAAAQPLRPADFDEQAFLETARKHYLRLQQAWDAGDLKLLEQFCTLGMYAELEAQIRARQGLDKTEVVTLEARLLGLAEQGGEYLASVEFAGLVREETFGAATPMREIWTLAKPTNGSSGWLLAGIQQLDA